MKKIFFLVPAALFGSFLRAQDPYAYTTVPQPFPPLSLSLPAATQWGYSVENEGPIIAPASGTFDISPTSTVEFTSGQSVELKPGFSASPTTGLFHAQVAPVDGDMALFNPANVGAELDVEQYEKLEFGVKLPANVLDAISHFKLGSGSPRVNPFDPTQLIMTVTYRHYASINSNSPDLEYDGFGFYYEEFAHDNSAVQFIGTWTSSPIPTDYNIRFRWAPPTQGWWKVDGTVTCQSQSYLKSFQFWMNCVQPTDPENLGYVTRSQGEHYLRLGGETWMPFGNNIQWPLGESPELMDLTDDYTPYDIPSDRYDDFYTRMVDLKNGGANFFRTILWPQSTDIEFEEAGNYFSRSPFIANRMYNAWEVDQMLNEARSLHMYIEFTSMINTQLMTPGPYAEFYWDWGAHDTWQHAFDADDPTGFGYSFNGIFTPVDFLTVNIEREKFKYRLQYMMARWGYARQIAIFQLVSEVNSIGVINRYSTDANGNLQQDPSDPSIDFPYLDDPQVPTDLAAWHAEMLHFLKHDLGMKQLLSESYTTLPSPNDYSYDLDDVDIRDFNSYPDHFHPTYGQQVYDNFLNMEFRPANGIRPTMNSETGGLSIDNACGPTEWILAQWIYPFSGMASGGINWLREDQFQPSTPLYSMIGTVKDFIGNEDFNAGWTPRIAIKGNTTGDYQVETNYMLNSSEYRAMGVIINRSYNGYVKGCVPDNPNNHPLAPNDQAQIVHYNDGTDRLKLDMNAPNIEFTEEFYNIFTGAQIPNSTVVINADANGDLEVQFPDLDVINNVNPLVAFKVYSNSGHRTMQETVVNSLFVDSIRIYPNPATEQLKVDLPCDKCAGSYKIVSVLGEQVKSGNLTGPENAIDVSTLANGLYMLYIRNDETEFKKSFSIIK